MKGLSSGLDRRQSRVHAVVTARTEEDLDLLGQTYDQVARLFKKGLTVRTDASGLGADLHGASP